jgi:UDP-N-acetylmuramate--alanine ligase
MIQSKNFNEYKKFHFIGIGGIGMSALARLLKSKNKIISGSDSSNSEIIESLQKEGIKVSIGHGVENLEHDTDCVVYTLAISRDNPEFLRAQEMGLPFFTYAQMLGQVSSGMKTIAVSGTHGKTTTTAMINSALRGAGLKPNMIVGSLLSEGKTNFLAGENSGDHGNDGQNNNGAEIFLAEACEYKKSFLNLLPTILVITNIEEDHLDFYKDLSEIKSAFMEMADKVPENGKIICDFEDKNISEILEKYRSKCINSRDFISSIPELIVLGEHNVRNAAMAIAVAKVLNLDLEKAKNGVAGFKGTWRRLEHHGQNKNGALIYDDYGHHPTEILASFNALRQKYPNKKITIFFQPHLYSRTKMFFDDFVNVLEKFDKVYLLPIYAAREVNDSTISSEKIAEIISGAEVLQDFAAAKKKVLEIKDDSIILTMGAGDVYLILK